jgi:hypothetical protein
MPRVSIVGRSRTKTRRRPGTGLYGAFVAGVEAGGSAQCPVCRGMAFGFGQVPGCSSCGDEKPVRDEGRCDAQKALQRMPGGVETEAFWFAMATATRVVTGAACTGLANSFASFASRILTVVTTHPSACQLRWLRRALVPCGSSEGAKQGGMGWALRTWRLCLPRPRCDFVVPVSPLGASTYTSSLGRLGVPRDW